jgi:hypothetical protein
MTQQAVTRRAMTTIGIIGSRRVGSNLARAAIASFCCYAIEELARESPTGANGHSRLIPRYGEENQQHDLARLLVRLFDDGLWRSMAACRSADPDLFFPLGLCQ